MGEKETATTMDAAEKSASLNVSATPGGSQSAGLAGKTPDGNLAADGDALAGGPGSAGRAELNAINVKLA